MTQSSSKRAIVAPDKSTSVRNGGAQVAKASKPNILVIRGDDSGMTLLCLGLLGLCNEPFHDAVPLSPGGYISIGQRFIP